MSGFIPNDFGNEHKNSALSKSILSNSKPLGIETFFNSSLIFDLVFSNSVIEHLFTKENQQKMANEVIRVGKNYFIQTPNKYFLIEPHWVFPLFQFLPFSLKVYLTQHFNLGHIPKSESKELAINQVNEIILISKKELKELFTHSEIYTEYFLGLGKSYTAYNIS